MENNFLLSICIPTYNREIYLDKLIESIVNQEIFKSTDEIEIVIDDWPSIDNTKELVEKYQKKFPWKIRYFRNEKAIWMCPALIEAIELSNSEYTWLFWSDDLMTKYALERTIKIIKENNPWVILSDRIAFSNDNEVKKMNIELNKKDIILNSWQDFFNYLWKDSKNNWSGNGNYFTFMSIFCFKHSIFLNNKNNFLKTYWKNYKKLEKNYFNYILILFSNLKNEKIILIKEKILVFARWWNNWWSFKSMDIFNDLYFLIKVIRKEYNISFKCNYFFNYMLLYWFIPSIWWIIRKNKFTKIIYWPLSKIAMKILYK